MARSYSEDLRVRVIAAVRGGLSTRQTAARFGIGVSTVGTWYRRYRATGSALKETAHAAEQERPDVARRRLAWLKSQSDLDPSRLVFIDETGASTKMARL